MSVGTYLKQNWFILFLTVGFGVSGIYFYFESQEARDPVFVVDPDRVEIVRAARVAQAPIKVLRRDNTPVRSDIYAARFYFWNAGKRPIKSAEVEEAIRVTLDSGSEILDFKRLKLSRLPTHARLVPTSVSGSRLRTLVIIFSILEQDDGLTGQIIYEGGRDARLAVSGTVEGVPAGISTRLTPSFWSILRRKIWKILGGALGAGLVFSLMIRFIPRKRGNPPVAVPRPAWSDAISAGLFIVVMTLAVSTGLAFANRLDDPPASVVTMVPRALSLP
jgi:hypothetical protein